MTLSRRQIWLLAIVLLSLVLLTLFSAPGGRDSGQGSTYTRSPDGYGAWYAFMERQGVTMQRWKKPLNQIEQRSSDLITLVRVSNGIEPLRIHNQEWVARGNVLVLLGATAPATKAPFSSDIASEVGAIRIETSRRYLSPQSGLLKDSFGAIVWAETIGKGKVIYASAPFLAANAYQDFPGNFKYLAKLVTEAGNSVWVDEYVHGYKDAEVIEEETSGSLWGYLAKTPLLLLALQSLVIVVVLFLGQNQRLGRATILPKPAVDNSEAYIQAMGAVLRKANGSPFVMDTLRKAEQREIQRALGLGLDSLPLETLVHAWTQQTQRPAAELEVLLKPNDRPVSEQELWRWVEALRSTKSHLPTVK